MTEGKATGIPTIIKEMRHNGSSAARFETDEARTCFIVTFPIHVAFLQNDAQNDAQNKIVITYRQSELLKLIKANRKITRIEMSERLKVSKPTVERDIKFLREQGVLNYSGSAKSGEWIINRSIGISIKQKQILS